MPSIASAVASIKRTDSLVPAEEILLAAARVGHRFRDRVFGPVLTVQLLVLQVLHGNVSCRRTLRKAGLEEDPTCYARARHRLPVSLFEALLEAVTRRVRDAHHHAGLWRGHRVFAIDGSGIGMQDTPELRERFGVPGERAPGCGNPVMHTLWLIDAATGLITGLATNPWNTHDLASAKDLHQAMEEDDVLVADRAFGTFAHLAHLVQAGKHGVLRLHQNQIVSFKAHRKAACELPKSKRAGKPRSKWLRKLGRLDQVVRYQKPDERPAWMTAEAYALLPEELVVRELRYRIDRTGFRTKQVTLITSLTDPARYPKSELAALYGQRWRVETDLRDLKQTLGADVLRCGTVAGVGRELLTFALVYNLVRELMLEAADRQGCHPRDLMFVDALDILRESPELRCLLTIMFKEHRPGRSGPRTIKRRKDRYSYAKETHAAYQARIGAQELKVA